MSEKNKNVNMTVYCDIVSKKNTPLASVATSASNIHLYKTYIQIIGPGHFLYSSYIIARQQ